MAFRRSKYQEVPVVPVTRGTLAEQLAALRASRPERLAPVEARRHAAAVEAARAVNEADLARQRLAEAERAASGAWVSADRQEHELEKQLAATCSPEIGRFLDVLDEWWQKHRHEAPEAESIETHRQRIARFPAIRRAVVDLQVAEVPDLGAVLAALAQELNLPWQPWASPRPPAA